MQITYETHPYPPQTTMTEKQKYEADETQRAAEIAAQISSSGALSTPDTRFAKSYVLGAWGKEKRPSSPDARDAPVPSAAPVAVRGLPSPDSATEAAAKSYKKSYSIGAWGQLTRTGEDTDQPAAKSAEEGKPMQVRSFFPFRKSRLLNTPASYR